MGRIYDNVDDDVDDVVEEEEDGDVEDYDVDEEEEEDRSQDRGNRFVRAAQSKCPWTCHRSMLMRDFTGKMPHRRPAVDQNPDTHFVRACAVEMHLEISHKPLYTEIYR